VAIDIAQFMKSKRGILGVGARIAGVCLHRSRALGVGHLKHGKQIVTLTLAAGHY
jgi:hypothetical protein